MTEHHKEQLRSLLDAALREDRGPTLAHRFYERLFHVAPGVRELFHNSLEQQEIKFTQMLQSLRDSLDRLDNLVPLLWQTGRNHRLYGAEEAHYAVVGEVLLLALEDQLGPEELTPERRAAWEEFYQLVALIMQQAARAQ